MYTSEFIRWMPISPLGLQVHENWDHISFLFVFVCLAPYSVCHIQQIFADWTNVCTDEWMSGNYPVMANSWNFALHYLTRQNPSPKSLNRYLLSSYTFFWNPGDWEAGYGEDWGLVFRQTWYKTWFPHLIISHNNLFTTLRVSIYSMDIPKPKF